MPIFRSPTSGKKKKDDGHANRIKAAQLLSEVSEITSHDAVRGEVKVLTNA
jgi:hypothetical protein